MSPNAKKITFFWYQHFVADSLDFYFFWCFNVDLFTKIWTDISFRIRRSFRSSTPEAIWNSKMEIVKKSLIFNLPMMADQPPMEIQISIIFFSLIETIRNESIFWYRNIRFASISSINSWNYNYYFHFHSGGFYAVRCFPQRNICHACLEIRFTWLFDRSVW